MDSARFTFLFHRYINQTCTEEEKREFLRLVNEPAYDVQMRDLMSGLWDSLQREQKLSEATADQILEKILAPGKKVIPLHKSFSAWSKVAAIVTLVVLCVGALYYGAGSQPEKQIAESEGGPAVLEHQVIKLPDGSVVFLNAGSSLKYPESFDDKANREVFLQGEGYFDVQHDPHKAFIVHTGNLRTTVLGTAFNIKAYPQDKNITVTVTRGKVKVSDDTKLFGIITPDQQITFDKNHQEVNQQKVDSRSAIAWADKDLFFDDITVAEAVGQLEQRFQVKVGFGNEKLKDCRFTATFVRGEDLEQILTVICEFNGSSFSRDAEGNIRIEGIGC